MLRKDLTRDPGVTVSLLMVIFLGACLMATGAMVIERLAGAGDQLFRQTKPPHFLQMHSGDYDQNALDAFAAKHPEIDQWFVERTVGVGGPSISWQRPAENASGSLGDSLIDNLFVTQNEQFDHLIGPDGTPVTPTPGSVYIPVAYQQSHDLRAGDLIRVDTGAGAVDLQVAGTVRDGQMASSLSSSTRFVVAAQDWEKLAVGENFSHEAIIEYRLKDVADIPALQAAYEAEPGLPRNGQAVTYTLIQMINVISDGLVALALMLVSLALVAIALLNLRFVIRGTLEDDVRQIGTMRAIGLSPRMISGLYLTRFRVLAFAGCALGLLAAVPISRLLTQGIAANYAEPTIGPMTVLAPVLAVVVVYLVIVGMCRTMLRAVRRVDVVSALVHGSMLTPKATARRARARSRQAQRTRIDRGNPQRLNSRLGLVALRSDLGQWLLLPVVFALSTLVVILPVAVHGTFASPQFVTYMGSPERDLRTDIQFADSLDATRDEVLSAMRSSGSIEDIAVNAVVLAQVQGNEGWESQPIDVGEQSGTGISYVEGQAPASGQVAVSVMAADKFGAAVGRDVPVQMGGEQRSLTVSGIYQDVTSGGVTMKVQAPAPSGASAYTVFANVTEGTDPQAVAAELNEAVPDARTIPMAAYVDQTFSYVTDGLRNAAIIAVVLALGICALITLLFLRLRLARERGRTGVLRAVGFSRAEVAWQTRLRTGLVVIAGVAVGTVLAATLGPSVVGTILSLAGVGMARMSFLSSPLLTFGVLPVALVAIAMVIAFALTSHKRADDLSAWLKG